MFVIDEEYAAKFAAEEQTGKLAACFASLAIFISCLGLFGMAAFMAERRIKEIGIRKVLGPSGFNVWRMMSNDFVMLVIIYARVWKYAVMALTQAIRYLLIIVQLVLNGFCTGIASSEES